MNKHRHILTLSGIALALTLALPLSKAYTAVVASQTRGTVDLVALLQQAGGGASCGKERQ